jgi:hypothetical protein
MRLDHTGILGLAVLVLTIVPGCGSQEAGGDADAAPLEPYQCQTTLAADSDMCSLTWTGQVSACSVGPDGTPSPNGSLEVMSPEGTHGYICASLWNDKDGYFFSNDREHLTANAADCCQPLAAVQTGKLESDPSFGPLHGPTHIKPQEMLAPPGGELRQNPFSVVVKSAATGQVYLQEVEKWKAWAGDGQPHSAPDGSGSYYFPAQLSVNYVVVPTSAGAPLVVIAPEVSMDPDFKTPLGHPTLGACADRGGSPLAFIAGDVFGTTVSNGSGRFGYELTVTRKALENTATLFNCYGIPITNILFTPPELH